MKPSRDSYSMILYGDSISRGVVYDEDKKKYGITKKSFASTLSKLLSCTFYNASSFGNTLCRGIRNLQKDIEKRNPNIVVMEFGGNDCDFCWDEVAMNPSGDHEPNTSVSTFQSKLLDTVQYLKATDIFPVLLTLPPLVSDRYWKWVSDNDCGKMKNILQWLGDVEQISRWQSMYNDAIVAIAEKTKSRWIDIRNAFLSTNRFENYMCVDGIHPNIEGQQLISSCILRYLQKEYSFLLLPFR